MIRVWWRSGKNSIKSTLIEGSVSAAVEDGALVITVANSRGGYLVGAAFARGEWMRCQKEPEKKENPDDKGAEVRT